MQMVEKELQGYTIESPNQQSWHKTIMGFVDNTRQYNNKFHTSPNIIERLKKEALMWQTWLSLTGGSIRTDKCAYYILKWSKKGTMELTNTTSEEIRINNDKSTDKNNTKVIEQLSTDQPFTYVGITTTPNRNTFRSKTKIKEICRTFTHTINTSQLPHKYYHIAQTISSYPN